MPNTKNIKKEEVQEIVKQLAVKARENDWVFYLDKIDDTLYYSPSTVPNGAELYQVTDEFAVYLGKNRDLQGVAIEYYSNNFLSEHKSLKKLTEDVFILSNNVQEISLQKDEDEQISLFRDLFERTLISEASGADLHIPQN